jgi:hypothetical protein
MSAHSARAWAQPDTRRPCAQQSGSWDVYCACCGYYLVCLAQAQQPDPQVCQRCHRISQLTPGTLVARLSGS